MSVCKEYSLRRSKGRKKHSTEQETFLFFCFQLLFLVAKVQVMSMSVKFTLVHLLVSFRGNTGKVEFPFASPRDKKQNLFFSPLGLHYLCRQIESVRYGNIRI